MSNTLTDLGEVIASKLPNAVTASGVNDFGELVLNVKLEKCFIRDLEHGSREARDQLNERWALRKTPEEDSFPTGLVTTSGSGQGPNPPPTSCYYFWGVCCPRNRPPAWGGQEPSAPPHL